MREQLINADLAARLKTLGHWERESACRGNGVRTTRPWSPSALFQVVSLAATTALEPKIKTLQAEIAKLEAIVAGQRADLERERHRANVLADELLKATLSLPPSCRPMATLEDGHGGERGWRSWRAAPSLTSI